MKLLLLSLLAVLCSTVVTSSQRRLTGGERLGEILRFVQKVEIGLTNSEHLINTPPQDIETCCCLTALRCYRTNLRDHFNSTVYVRKLMRGLNSTMTVDTMRFCNSDNTTNICQHRCDMHPKKSAREFLDRLRSLIQMANSQLTLER